MSNTVQTPESSNMEWFSYDPKTSNLSIKFKSGKTFVYANVPAAKFGEMKQSPSRGSYFAKHIKGHFDATIEENVF